MTQTLCFHLEQMSVSQCTQGARVQQSEPDAPIPRPVCPSQLPLHPKLQTLPLALRGEVVQKLQHSPSLRAWHGYRGEMLQLEQHHSSQCLHVQQKALPQISWLSSSTCCFSTENVGFSLHSLT